MRNLTVTICLAVALLLGSGGVSWSQDFQKGLTAAQSGDYATALREWEPLAEQGDAYAQHNLGWLYHQGKGVARNYKAAVKWYGLAAYQGVAEAQHNLGVMYGLGTGVIQDDVKAHMWANIAAMNGHKEGAILRGIAEEGMTAAQIAEAELLARQCFLKSHRGCLREGASQNRIPTIKWSRSAPVKGHVKSQKNLAGIYYNGQGIIRDPKEAFRWSRLAAQQGVAEAQYNLGVMYSNGDGVSQDYNEA
jgi:TPR repeat protein